jgi:hypothetical protein
LLVFNIKIPRLTAGGVLTLTANHTQALAAPGTAPNDELNGNQAPSPNSGVAPNSSDYVWHLGCKATPVTTLPLSLDGVNVTSPGPQSGTVGTALSLPIVAADSSNTPLEYAASGLPAGLAINQQTGVIAGTPAAAGVFDVTVRAVDTLGTSDSAAFTWTVTAPTTTPPPASPCVGPPILLFDIWNTATVQNGGNSPLFSTGGQTYCLLSIDTYHWNGGLGATPGTIALGSSTGTLGPWSAVGSPGAGGAQNVAWTVTPGTPTQPVIINGAYLCLDSDPTTWSQNALSGGAGFCKVWVEKAQSGF